MKVFKRLSRSLSYFTWKRIMAWPTIFSFQLVSWPVYARPPQIIVDGRSQTQLNTEGRVTDVTTKTLQGHNAVNSFRKFDVYSGNTVNLHVPQEAKEFS